MNNMNPIELMQLLRQTKNPQQLLFQLISNKEISNNPILANLISLAQQGKQDEIVTIARNIMKEQGRDFDTEFNSFRKTLGL